MRKLILVLILIAAIVAPALANSTVFNLIYTDVDKTFAYTGNIFTEFRTTDPSNVITDIRIKSDQTNNTYNGAVITVGTNLQYTVSLNKSYYLYVIPYGSMTCQAILTDNNGTNYQLFQLNGTSPIWDSRIIAGIKYDTETGETSFQCNNGGMTTLFGITGNGNFTSNIETINITNLPVGMPSNDIIIAGQAPFDVEGTYINYVIKSENEQAIKRLSPVTNGIYRGLNFLYRTVTLYSYGDLSGLIPFFQTIDWLFLIIKVMVSAFYIYPYLIGFWILIFGNIYSGYLASTPKDVIRNLIKYYGFVFSWAFILVTKIIELAMWVLRIIRG